MKLFALVVLILAFNNNNTTLTRTTSDAKMYSGTHANASVWDWSATLCKSSKYHQVDQTVASPYGSSCTSTLATGATKVADCEYPAVVKTSTSAATAYCGMCKKSKGGNTAYTSCAGTAITNCEYHSGTNCYSCKSKYAVASTGTTCSSFTTDSNCRRLNSDSTCGHCWHSYYFNGATCKLFAKLLTAGFVVISAFLF